MASVRVEGLLKRFGNVEALKGLSFDLADGSFFCLLGPPGAGKTTTLRIIAGLEKADAGQVWLDEQAVDEVHPKDRDVAMVFEDLALYPHWSGFDNIAHPLKLRKVPAQEIEHQVAAIADRLHIGHLLDRKPGTYSGGERRRLAIGRALVRRPRVLLLDEPLTDLDAKIRQEMTAELKRLQSATGQTMIYATHDFEEAMGMADQIMVINRGAQEQVGAPTEVYALPETAFAASFVGSPAMNLLPCRASTEDGKTRLEHPGFQIGLPREAPLAGEISLGIRPEHIELGPGGIPARVDIAQVLGDEQILDLSLTDGTVIKMVASLEIGLQPGAELTIRFPAQHLCAFDPASGQRLAGPGLGMGS